MIATISHAKLREVEKLEEALWRSETRFDLNFQEQIFADDFFEFSRSGRRYIRSEMIRGEVQPINAKLPLENFKVTVIDRSTVLTTYISEVQYETVERANRSSVWTLSERGWQLRFHQGTPTK